MNVEEISLVLENKSGRRAEVSAGRRSADEKQRDKGWWQEIKGMRGDCRPLL